jgi:hypothetical protein
MLHARMGVGNRMPVDRPVEWRKLWVSTIDAFVAAASTFARLLAVELAQPTVAGLCTFPVAQFKRRS